ncbi:MAG: LysM peptidoglycan-binding domain-containing protein [Clostridia bacterium]|nr:LysM peptidoglycan-binding domain-containing protein [Clostridia bacterium]
MKHGSMRFNGITLHHNPDTLLITDSNSVEKELTLNLFPSVSLTNNNPTVIKGSGVFYGENAFEQYLILKKACNCCEIGVLSLSGIYPFYALLYQLELECTPVDDIVKYRFFFIEVPKNHENSTLPYYYTVKENQDLWDISYLFSIPIEKLLVLNPQIRSLNSVQTGDRIWLQSGALPLNPTRGFAP